MLRIATPTISMILPRWRRQLGDGAGFPTKLQRGAPLNWSGSERPCNLKTALSGPSKRRCRTVGRRAAAMARVAALLLAVLVYAALAIARQVSDGERDTAMSQSKGTCVLKTVCSSTQ